MDWGGLISAGLGLFGQREASDAAGDAAQAQVTAAAIAAEAGKFKPYGVTTGFGSSWFDPEAGTAGYDLDPALAAYRDKLMMMGAEGLPGMPTSEQDAAAAYQQQLLGVGGTGADIANRYASLAGQAQMPTNIGDAYAGISGPQFNQNATGIANQYTQAGSQLLGQGTTSAGDLYNQIRDMQRPEEERARGQMERGLYGSGRLGMKLSQYGGTPEQMAFEKALGETRNQAAYQAINQADQLSASQRQQAMSLSQMGLGATGQANQLGQMGFQNQMNLAGSNLQAQQAQANLANTLNQNALGSYGTQLQQAQGLRGGAMSELDAAIARSQGLFTGGMGVEGLGLQSMDIGSALGAKQATAGAATGGLLTQAAANSGNALMAQGTGWADYLGGLGQSVQGMNWGR